MRLIPHGICVILICAALASFSKVSAHILVALVAMHMAHTCLNRKPAHESSSMHCTMSISTQTASTRLLKTSYVIAVVALFDECVQAAESGVNTSIIATPREARMYIYIIHPEYNYVGAANQLREPELRLDVSNVRGSGWCVLADDEGCVAAWCTPPRGGRTCSCDPPASGVVRPSSSGATPAAPFALTPRGGPPPSPHASSTEAVLCKCKCKYTCK